jgi:tRNA(fMet)-specific endonuclease VapC
MYLLDTNVCIRLLKGDPVVEARLRDHHPREIRLSSITKAELLYGARHSSQIERNLRRVAEFAQPLISLPFDDVCAEHYGRIRADLALHGKPIGPADLWIAAIAQTHDLTLVTHNTNEFCRVPGLRLEDWEVAG